MSTAGVKNTHHRIYGGIHTFQGRQVATAMSLCNQNQASELWMARSIYMGTKSSKLTLGYAAIYRRLVELQNAVVASLNGIVSREP
jgi:deoxyhypusine synthase